MLNRFGYSDCTSAPTPYDPSVLLRKNRKIAQDQLRYSQIIGSLMYLASATMPDISFAVSKLSRFVSNPGDDHWHALERVMRYLNGTKSYGIHYTGYLRVLEGYCDVNWISDTYFTKQTYSGGRQITKIAPFYFFSVIELHFFRQRGFNGRVIILAYNG